MKTSFNYSKAENRAKSLLDSCGLEDPTGIPISDIILSQKAFYYEKPLVGKEGKTITVSDRSIITINSNIEFEPKKRFASTHELGHYEMHRKITPIFIDTEYDLINWYKGRPQELEANEFAAEFLMPSELFAKECERKKFTPSLIEHLASRFQVSKTAAILKFVKRGNHPVFIVYCKDYKMRWWKKSDGFPYYSLFESDLEPPEGTVAYELFTTNKVYLGDEKKQDIWKSDWFIMKDDERDTRFYEYCLYVKSYNYSISVIWED